MTKEEVIKDIKTRSEWSYLYTRSFAVPVEFVDRVIENIKQIDEPNNDYDTICNLMMNCDVRDLETEQVEYISNLATNLLCDCEMELRNRASK